MNILLTLYTELHKVYTEQVQKIEAIKTEYSKEHRIEWVPHLVLNGRMFTYDEYLQNPFYGGFCLEEKIIIMPHLVHFIAAFESSTEEVKRDFQLLKPNNEYQEYLDDLLKNKLPFLEMLKSQLRNLQEIQYRYDIPSLPKRSNATRQLAKYKLDRKEYFEKVESLDRCRNEVNDRIKSFIELKNKFE